MSRMLLPAAAALALALTACGDAGPTGPRDGLEGSYDLVRVNGESLPFSVPFVEGMDGAVVTIEGGSFSLAGSGGCSVTLDMRYEEEGSPAEDLTNVVACTYQVAGQSLQVTTEADEQFTATWSGSTLSLDLGPFQMDFGS